jgi:hypothetical protein
MRVQRLCAEDVSLVGAIDRSEHIDVQYRVSEGQLADPRLTFGYRTRAQNVAR